MRGNKRPFVGLVFCAVAGILGAQYSGLAATVWLIVFVLSLVASIFTSRRMVFALMVMSAFGGIHAMRLQESGERLLAEAINRGDLPFAEGEAVVLDEPVITSEEGDERIHCHFPAKLVALKAGNRSLPVNAKVLVYWTGPVPAYGDLIAFQSTVSNIQEARNPGQFDARLFYSRKGIYSQWRIRNERDGSVVSGGHGNPLRALALHSRRHMVQWLGLDLEDAPEVSEALKGIVLGASSGVDDGLKAKFRNTGTLHLFAVSGLHVGMLAVLLWLVLRMLPVPRASLVWLIVPILVFYALVTGLRPSVVRATAMTVIVLIGVLIDRRSSMANNLAAAALLLLAVDGNQLFNSGFQLSFTVVSVILLLAGPLARRFEKWGRPDSFLPEKLWNRRETLSAWCGLRVGQLAAVSIAATLGSAAWMWLGFHLVTPISVAANMVVVPLAFLVLSLGLMTIVCAPFAPWLAVIFNNSNWLVLKVMLGAIDLFAAVPYGHFRLALPEMPSEAIAEVLVFDVNTGGAAAISAGGNHWLLDSGSDYDMQRIIAPALWQEGVNTLDGMLLTHGDARHIGGAMAGVEEFAPRRIQQSALADKSSSRRAFALYRAVHRIGSESVRPGWKVVFSENVEWEVLYPPVGIARRLADDKALIVLLKAGPTRVLFLSDAGLATERWLAENYPDLRCEVVVKGWHSRDYSGDTALFSQLSPALVITGAVDIRSESRMAPGWRDWIESRGTKLFKQETTGAVQMRFYVDGFEAESFLTGEVFSKRAQ